MIGGASVTPFEYLQCYRNLKVQLVNGTTLLGTDGHEYRNSDAIFNERNLDADKTNDVDLIREDLDAAPGWTIARVALLNKIGKHGESLGKGRYRLRFPVPTKANP